MVDGKYPVSYYIDSANPLFAAIKKRSNLNTDEADKNLTKYFTLAQIGTTTRYQVSKASAAINDADIINYLKSLNIQNVAGLDSYESTEGANNKAYFRYVDYGYYLLYVDNGKTGTDLKTGITINSAAPDSEIYLKLDKAPSNPQKVENKTSISIGDEIKYMVSFRAVNYEVTSATGSTTNRAIRTYKVADTADPTQAGMKDLKVYVIRECDLEAVPTFDEDGNQIFVMEEDPEHKGEMIQKLDEEGNPIPVTRSVIDPTTGNIKQITEVRNVIGIDGEVETVTTEDGTKNVTTTLEYLLDIADVPESARTTINPSAHMFDHTEAVLIGDEDTDPDYGYYATQNTSGSGVINIPWAKPITDDEGTVIGYEPLYDSPSYVIVEYTHIVGEGIDEIDAEGQADGVFSNKAEFSYSVEKDTQDHSFGSDTVYAYSTGISLRKLSDINDDNSTLDGAKFILYRYQPKVLKDEQTGEDVLDANGNPVYEKDEDGNIVYETDEDGNLIKYYYKDNSAAVEAAIKFNNDNAAAIANYNFNLKNAAAIELGTAEAKTDPAPVAPMPVPWSLMMTTDRNEASEVIADNSYFTMEFKGLRAGEYILEEVAPPAGYELPAWQIQLLIQETGVVDEDVQSTQHFIVYAKTTLSDTYTQYSDNNHDYYTIKIENKEGAALPTTGAAGTIALIGIGSVLFMGTAVVLVTKKRAYNEGV